ncbi:MAG: hypothetical protein ACM3NF_10660 [Gemmatimonadota bacterium]
MSDRRPASAVACAAVLAVATAWILLRPLPAACGDIEFLRGTVDKFRPGSLSLVDVTLQGEENAGRPVMVMVNDETEYFDGLRRTTKESVTDGAKVLVKSVPAGTGRIAVLVRIIGGKAL